MSLESLFYQVTSPQRRYYHYPMYWVLTWVSAVYGLIQRLRVRAYARGWLPSRRLEVPVISVGNLTLGGTGKTPMVMWLAETLTRMGCRPAVLSRGYGADAPAEINVVSDGQGVLLPPEEAGDEPVMMARRLKQIPVLSGRRRHALGRHARQALGAEVMILDDGFQHLALKRDLNLLLLDARRPFGNGRVFPAGELREPLSALERADAVILTRVPEEGMPLDLSPFLPPGTPIIESRLVPESVEALEGTPTHPLSWLAGKSFFAFCGIGQPEDFFAVLEQQGARLAGRRPFPDHFDYPEGTLERLVDQARHHGAEALITTEKDAVKLRRQSPALPLWVLRMQVDLLSGREELLARLTSCLQPPALPVR